MFFKKRYSYKRFKVKRKNKTIKKYKIFKSIFIILISLLIVFLIAFKIITKPVEKQGFDKILEINNRLNDSYLNKYIKPNNYITVNQENYLIKNNPINNFNNKSYLYFCCFIGIGKQDNRYAKELVEHYISIGFEKFYLGDNNNLDVEPLSDVLKDYIIKGYVDIIDIRGKNVNQTIFYNYAFNLAKDKCKWLSFFDFDEHLEFTDKNMTIQKYLSQDIFNKCDVVKINWLMFYDNDLIYYDNRTLKERFPIPNKKSFDNNFHKSILRSKNYSGILWTQKLGPHQPNESLVNMCDSLGKIANLKHGILGRPNYKYCHLNHYSTKTIEEFAHKMKRGFFWGNDSYLQSLKKFFSKNNFSLEKLEVAEKILQQNFSGFRKKY